MLSALLVFAFMFGYAFFSLIWPCRINVIFKSVWTIAFALCSIKCLIYTDTGNLSYPNLRPSQVLFIETLFNTIFLAVIMAMIKDVLLLILWCLIKVKLLNAFTFKQSLINISISLSALVLSVLGTFSQVQPPKVNYQEVYFETLTNDFDGYKIAQISDLHMGPVLRRYYLNEVVAQINSNKPDLIVLTGDTIDAPFDIRRDDFDPMAMLNSKDGVLAVTGEHDYYNDYKQWHQFFSQMGIRYLCNESVIIKRGIGTIKITGIPDSYGATVSLDEAPNLLFANFNIIDYDYKKEHVSFGQTQSNRFMNKGLFDYDVMMLNFKKVQRAITEAWSMTIYENNRRNTMKFAHESSFADIQILLAHNPNITKNHDLNAELVLSGHTHGGVMFFLKPIVAYFNNGLVSGLYSLDNLRQIFISNGAGIWSAFSCRIFVPAQIDIIVLKKGKAPKKNIIQASTSSQQDA